MFSIIAGVDPKVGVLLGVLGIAKLMRFIPRSVMVGFVNALAILVCISQVSRTQRTPPASSST